MVCPHEGGMSTQHAVDSGLAATTEAVDSLSEPMLETAQDLGRPLTQGRSARVNHKKQFSLLVVRGDGARVLRLSFPKRLPLTILVAGVVVAGGFSVVVGDWWHVRQRIRDSASLYQQIEEQRAMIDKFNRRVTELRQEVASWGELHGHIWEAFGPDVAPKNSGTGIGGTSVKSPAAGTVIHAGPHSEYGLAVIIDHGQDVRSLYGHLSKINVRQGQTVERGTELALTGNTGRSSGPHLHYEVMVRGQAVNPRAYLWD